MARFLVSYLQGFKITCYTTREDFVDKVQVCFGGALESEDKAKDQSPGALYDMF